MTVTSLSTGSKLKKADWILIGLLALASCAWCVTSSQRLGATFDEPFYLDAGLDYWRRGNFSMLLSAGVMPLAPHLQTLPIHVAEQLSGRVFTVEHDLGEMLQLARPVTLVFWLLLLASVMRLGNMFGGSWAGRAAALLVAVEPNFLAHASLATTDIALAACFTAFTVQFVDGRDRSALGRIILPAVWLALAIAAKVSAIALVPFAAAVAVLVHPRAPYRRLLVDTGVILVLAVVLITLYCGTGGQTWLHGTLASMPADHSLRPLVAWLGSLPIFPNAFYAMWFQLSHNTTGQAVYIAGVASTTTLWFYLPAVLSIKLTIPLLVAAIMALATAPSRRTALIVFVGALAASMIVFRVQTGVRFVLPLVALGMAWIGAQAARSVGAGRLRWAWIAIPVLMAIESLLVWPDGLRYVNQIWGGVDAGYRVVSDSNYDWGQGLPELAEWQQAEGRPMAVWYFGTDTRFPQLVRYNPRIAGTDRSAIDGRLLAVSASFLYGGYLETPGPSNDLIRRLRAIEPIARTSTFAIFDRGY